ncbi:alpha-L-rhamnosidase [Algibacter lectus]|uniref:alpha-L-rhamnosidase-related protein n=1 Tax=Algibacter lectus TaxID=221126 RepID=UPI0008E6DF83|nr:alpha-L-rhamnosidase C-terminal domain-containing protein [Algibacter lectus]SFB88180.1 alpha-L-rhamnosidase [Algibacter lectus]
MRRLLLNILIVLGAFLKLQAQDYNEVKAKLEYSQHKPVKIEKLGHGHYFIDFGKAYFGTVTLKPHVSQKDSIVFHLGEQLSTAQTINRKPKGTIRYQRVMLPELNKGEATKIILPKVIGNTKPQAIALPDSIGVIMPFRYCEIENLKIPIDQLEITQKAVHYKFNDNASFFTSSDTILNQIWDICKHTIKATSFSGYYVDGDRERIPYEADAYINQLSHYAFDNEYSLARRTNEYFISSPTWPTEWILHTAKMFYYDYLYTGNTESISKYYDKLKDKTLIELARTDGLITTDNEKLNKELMTQLGFKKRKKIRDIVDWPMSERDGYEMKAINTVVNSFYYENLQMMSRIAEALDKKEDVLFFKEKANQVKTLINDKLFDQSTGLYIDGEGSSHSSLHANMFPLAFGIIPEARKESVIKFIKSKGKACSVYAAQYLLEGLYKSNEATYAKQLITTTDHDRTWWNMIKTGSTMTLEAWDIKYKPNLDWNHAWGAAPGNIITRNLWGIIPLTPGFENAEIHPQLDNLSFSEIKVPTIKGAITAKFKKSDAHNFTYEVTLPKSMNGQFRIPTGHWKTIKLNGKLINESPKLKLSEGHNIITLKK